jgi:hypothetical protein
MSSSSSSDKDDRGEDAEGDGDDRTLLAVVGVWVSLTSVCLLAALVDSRDDDPTLPIAPPIITIP